ncbi:Fur family transcriptional regulator [uncultured Campylobacter sp.]|uniref:Fur family transcriptional regulator n=1 Tax=uncultured Campylobacter sp. TaxID=218934 RepID=UPI0026390D71|nr:transcriptional repressor [uncultured Campylobacter sp.]
MLTKLLKQSGLKATKQRLFILEELLLHTHPTIDDLYAKIKQKEPKLSLATLYKNLNLLIEKDIVTKIEIKNEKSRFDIFDKPHIHSVCSNCKEIVDLDDELLDLCKEKIEERLNEKVERLHVVLSTASCKKCKEG